MFKEILIFMFKFVILLRGGEEYIISKYCFWDIKGILDIIYMLEMKRNLRIICGLFYIFLEINFKKIFFYCV